MIVMTITTYPMQSIPKTVEVFLDLIKAGLPDYIEMTGPFTRWGGEGIIGYTIYDIEDDKAMEGMKVLVARDAKFSVVEGFKMESFVLLTAADSLAAIGEKMP
jgi:hypothetical protein